MSSPVVPGTFAGFKLFGRWTPVLACLCPVLVLGWCTMVAVSAAHAWLILHGEAGPLPFSALWAHLFQAGLGAMTVLTSAALVVYIETRQARRLAAQTPGPDTALPRRLLNWRVTDTADRFAVLDRPGPLYRLVPLAFAWTLLTVPIAVILVVVRLAGGRGVEYPVAVALWLSTSAALTVFMALRRGERLAVDRTDRSLHVVWREGGEFHETTVGFDDAADVSVVRRKDRRRELRLDLATGQSCTLMDVAPDQAAVLEQVCQRVCRALDRDPGDTDPGAPIVRPGHGT